MGFIIQHDKNEKVSIEKRRESVILHYDSNAAAFFNTIEIDYKDLDAFLELLNEHTDAERKQTARKVVAKDITVADLYPGNMGWCRQKALVLIGGRLFIDGIELAEPERSETMSMGIYRMKDHVEIFQDTVDAIIFRVGNPDNTYIPAVLSVKFKDMM